MKRKKNRILAGLLAASMLMAMLTGCSTDKASGQAESVKSKTEVTLKSGETITVDKPTTAESHEALYNTLMSVQAEAGEIYEVSEQLAGEENVQINPDVELYGEPDFSGADAPAEGVKTDELIITDGTNIYMVCSSELVIVAASGKNTREIGRTFVTGTIPAGYMGSETPKAIYLKGDSLYVVTYEYLYKSEDGDGGYTFDNSEQVHVKQFDISNPKKPTLVSDFAQSGCYLNSYVVNDMLYLIGAYSIWLPEEANVSSYVPYTVTNGENTVLDAEKVYICPGMDSTDYTVISAYDMTAGANANTIATTGYNVWNTADGESLYLGRTSYDYDLGEAYEKDQYTVNDLNYSANTELLRVKMDSSLEILASACVAGYLHDQSAMALADGELYLAATCTGYTCQIFTDEKYGFTNYLAGERISGNAAYVLDQELSVLRTVEDLGDGADVYAVRMDGGVAYTIGYDSMTPISQTDLSKKNPKVQKFSAAGGEGHYLYAVGEDLLVGLGTVEEKKGVVTGLQLSAYSTKSGTMELLENVFVSESWNFAMTNSRAVLTIPEKNLIAIPTETAYCIYSVKDGEVEKLGEVELGYVSGDGRLLQVGKNLYFCNDAAVVVVNAEKMTQVGRCDFAYG